MVLVLDLSKPNALWGTMERLLQTTRTQVEKACSKQQRTVESKAGSKQQAQNRPPMVLPKDHPVRQQLFLVAMILKKHSIINVKGVFAT